MAVFLPQARAEMPRNAMLDFSPINNAIDTNRRNAMLDRQFTADQEHRQSQLGIQREQLDMRRQEFDTNQRNATVQRLGRRAQAIAALPESDPRRAQAWQAILREHPGAAGLDQSWHDPIVGPQMLVAEVGEWEDPTKRRLLEAQVQKAEREAAGGGAEEFGKTGAVFQGADGRFYTIQFGARGTRNIVPVEAPGAAPGQSGEPTASQPLAPARGVMTVDEGTGTRVIDRATGRDVRSIDKNIAGAEARKVEGREFGELRSALPKLETGFRMFADKSERLVNRIDTAVSRISPWTTGAGGMLANLPMTEARALRNDLDTIRANIGFEELQAMRDASPTGGALGQVSEMENRLLQSVRAALDQLDRGENLAANLQIIRDSVIKIRQLKEGQLTEDRARAGAGAFSPGAAAGGNGAGWGIRRVD